MADQEDSMAPLLKEWMALAKVIVPDQFLPRVTAGKPEQEGPEGEAGAKVTDYEASRMVVGGVLESVPVSGGQLAKLQAPDRLLPKRVGQMSVEEVKQVVASSLGSTGAAEGLLARWQHVSLAEDCRLTATAAVAEAPDVGVMGPIGGGRPTRSAEQAASAGGRTLGTSPQGVGDSVHQSAEAVLVKCLAPLLLEGGCSRSVQVAFGEWWEEGLSPAAQNRLLPILVQALQPKAPAGPCEPRGGAKEKKTGEAAAGSGLRRAPSRETLLDRVPGLKSRDAEQGPGSPPSAAAARWRQAGADLEPWGILAVDLRAMRAAPLLRVLLGHVMRRVAATRRLCAAAAAAAVDRTARAWKKGPDAPPAVPEQEIASALLLHDSVMCQLLIEGCREDAALGDAEHPARLAEVRGQLMWLLQELLESSPLLLKLLHFQGYEPALLPLLLDSVPSMRDCHSFVAELLRQPEQHRQVTAVRLAAELAARQPTDDVSLANAIMVKKHVERVASHVAGSAAFLTAVIVPLARCIATVPAAVGSAADVARLCLRIGGPLVPGGPPLDRALKASADSALALLAGPTLQLEEAPPAA